MKKSNFGLFSRNTDLVVELIPAQGAEEPSVNAFQAPSTVHEGRVNRGMSYLAPGTVWEGTLHAVGDVEVAGKFKGELTTKSTAVLRADVQGNVTAENLVLSDSSLTGDVVVAESMVIKSGSKIKGNVRAKELRSAGEIIGDMKVSGIISLESTARVKGDVIAGNLSIDRGATLNGSVEINRDIRFEK